MSTVKMAALLGKTDPDVEEKKQQKKTNLSLVLPYSIGIEFELENLSGNFDKQSLVRDLWTETRDGSLRGDGLEFITRVPMKGDKAIVALENIYEAAKGSMAPLASLRTSAHVHVNVLDMTPEEIALYVTAGTLAEPYILSLTDDYRKYCGYCLDSTGPTGAVLSNLMRSNVGNLSKGIDSRYYGVNALSVYKHGTLEFRHFGVPHTIEDAVRNINVCLKLKKVAKAVSESLTPKLSAKNLEKALTDLRIAVAETLETDNIRQVESLLERVEIESAKNERYSAVKQPTAAEELVETLEQDTETHDDFANYGNEVFNIPRDGTVFRTALFDEQLGARELEQRVVATEEEQRLHNFNPFTAQPLPPEARRSAEIVRLVNGMGTVTPIDALRYVQARGTADGDGIIYSVALLPREFDPLGHSLYEITARSSRNRDSDNIRIRATDRRFDVRELSTAVDYLRHRMTAVTPPRPRTDGPDQGHF